MGCIVLVRCVLVLRCGVVSGCRLLPASGYHTTPAKPQRNTNTHRTRTTQPMKKTHEISRKLLRSSISEVCWAINNEIIKKVTSSWSISIQQMSLYIFYWADYMFRPLCPEDGPQWPKHVVSLIKQKQKQLCFDYLPRPKVFFTCRLPHGVTVQPQT